MPRFLLEAFLAGALAAALACGGAGPEPAAAPSEPAAAPAGEGFVRIFDGRTLDGWTLIGQTGEGYLVEDEAIVCPPKGGGNLFYDEELSDFVVRLEFQLTDDSNNGLCIRCPKTDKSLAYDGMELQVINNDSERYKDIETWQKHGSLYHVFPAKTGALKPTGEWNFQEVTVKGRQVTVVLNGTTILDANLDDAKDTEILAKHPGLQRTSGYFGFLGHNEPVKFRNIELKKL